MGIYNSSECRIRPLMDYLGTDLKKLNMVFSLVKIPEIRSFSEICYTNGKEKKEKALKPFCSHLKAIVDYISKTENTAIQCDKAGERIHLCVGEKRAEKAMEAKELIDRSYNSLDSSFKAWYILEGFSYPDIYIEGDDYIILVEGKWTESSITTHTEILPNRSQMIRHIQGALNACNNKKRVFAFYIVDDNCFYKADLTIDALGEQIEKETIKISDSDKKKILNSFFGFTTWQEIEQKIGIRFITKEEIDKSK